jgi:hypothetical protein
MRFALPALLLSILTAAPALATPEVTKGNHGTGNTQSYFAQLKITNACDEAVMISVGSYSYAALEPNASLLLGYWMEQKKTSVEVTASIELSPGVESSTTKKVQIQANQTTEAVVTCVTTSSGVTLSVASTVSSSTKALSQESETLLASGGGLSLLMLVGMLFGSTSAPVRRMPTAGRTPSPGDSAVGTMP